MSWGLIKSLSFLVFILCAACKTDTKSPTAVVYAASSLSSIEPALKIRAPFPLIFQFHSSSHIAHQLKLGARCDAVIIADLSWKNFLLEHHLIEPEHKIVARNSLVVAKNSLDKPSLSATGLTHAKKIIFADPDYVPLGRFSKMALSKQGVYQQIESRLVFAHSAENAVMLLKKGIASYAVLYASDIDEATIFVSDTIDENLYEPIDYYLARCRGKSSQQNDRLYQFLASSAFQTIIQEHGFRAGDVE